MDSRKNGLSSQLQALAEGTGVGIFGRWLLAPAEEIYIRKADPNNHFKYRQLIRETFKPSNLYRLNGIFFKTMLGQTIWKSFSTIGVIHYVDTFYAHESPEKKVLLMTALGVPAETLTTSYGEWKKTLEMRKISGVKPSALSWDFARALGGTGGPHRCDHSNNLLCYF